jgi:hypothetical protein
MDNENLFMELHTKKIDGLNSELQKDKSIMSFL